MDRFWKQFAELDIASEHNVFLRARLKLTSLYVLIIAVIVFGFSVFLYQSFEHNIKDVSDDDFAGVESHQHFVQNTLQSVDEELILADLVILIAAAGLSFVLAGKTLKPIQLSVEAQKAFAANASHELRTPLAVMRNDIEVFLRNAYPTKQMIEGTMKSNLEEIRRMSGIVEDLLVLARSDNRILQEQHDLDIGTLVKRVVDRIRSLADSRNIMLVTKPLDGCLIKGVESSLERVFLNILQNSLEYTPSGGSIIIEMEKKNAEIVVRVADTGSGIAPQDIPYVFKRFYKGNGAAGTGLGLSIVKEIIDQHHGRIAVESTEGKGTIFSLYFPGQVKG
jgi:two-component system sensor histidine kinase CiaH